MKNVLTTLCTVGLLTLGGVATAGEAGTALRSRIDALKTASPAKLDGELEATLAYDYIGAAALPNVYGMVDPAKRAEFLHLFSEVIRRGFMKNVGTLKRGKVVWGDEVHIPKDDSWLVKCTATEGRDRVDVDFKMVVEDGSWQVGDVIIDGSSTVGVYRRQLQKVLKRDGYDGIIRLLKKRLGTAG